MRWIKPNLKSIYGLLGQSAPPAAPVAPSRLQAVRVAMLDAAMACDIGKLHPHVVRRISYADDIRALWYARSDLMMALANERGEAFAQQQITNLSPLFDGLLPEAASYRQSRGPR